MIKSELVQRIAGITCTLPADVENIVNAILDDRRGWRGATGRTARFGAGEARSARAGRNPRTGAHVPVDRRACRSSRPATKCANG
jgi:integration host factor subunit beta